MALLYQKTIQTILHWVPELALNYQTNHPMNLEQAQYFQKTLHWVSEQAQCFQINLH
jgi:hypothetical protein